MREFPQPVFRTFEGVSLVGRMAIYDSQAAASLVIPQQWREFRQSHPELGSGVSFIGASPSTGDRKIHYLAGVDQVDGGSIGGERLVLEEGEYAMVQVYDPASLRDTWIWLLATWLPGSGRRERHAPEFERFSGISEEGLPVGMVEVWVPLRRFRESETLRSQSSDECQIAHRSGSYTPPYP